MNEDGLDTPKQIKTLAKLTHLAMGVVKSITDRSKNSSETSVPEVNIMGNEALIEKQARDDTEQKERPKERRPNQSNSLHRDRLSFCYGWHTCFVTLSRYFTSTS